MNEPKPGWRSSEFWLMLIALCFAMWAGWYVLTHADVELERFLTVLGAVGGVGGWYTQQRTSLKKAVPSTLVENNK